MRTPTVCAAVLLRDGRSLDLAFQQEASYLFHEKQQPGFDFIHRTVECTKAALGEGGLADYVDRQFRLIKRIRELTCGKSTPSALPARSVNRGLPEQAG